MPYQLSDDTKQLVKDCTATGAYSNPDEILRAALEALQQSDASLLKIQQAVDEWRAGDEGLPLDDAFQLIQQGRIDP
jgi:Arc/MetJ-type ribon-helix-helix transcriptional regulator